MWGPASTRSVAVTEVSDRTNFWPRRPLRIMLKRGAIARIHSLQTQQTLNGEECRVVKFDEASDRWHVSVLTTKKKLALRAANLEVSAARSGKSDKAAAPAREVPPATQNKGKRKATNDETAGGWQPKSVQIFWIRKMLQHLYFVISNKMR